MRRRSCDCTQPSNIVCFITAKRQRLLVLSHFRIKYKVVPFCFQTLTTLNVVHIYDTSWAVCFFAEKYASFACYRWRWCVWYQYEKPHQIYTPTDLSVRYGFFTLFTLYEHIHRDRIQWHDWWKIVHELRFTTVFPFSRFGQLAAGTCDLNFIHILMAHNTWFLPKIPLNKWNGFAHLSFFAFFDGDEIQQTINEKRKTTRKCHTTQKKRTLASVVSGKFADKMWFNMCMVYLSIFHSIHLASMQKQLVEMDRLSV